MMAVYNWCITFNSGRMIDNAVEECYKKHS